MRMRAGIVLQARMASVRLPGKALETIGPYSVLEHCLRRLMAAGVARVVLATTTKAEDDALERVAAGVGVPVYRGSETDVLARMHDVATAYGFDPVIRATGDNPAVDVQAPGRMLDVLRATGADYACEEGLPYGVAVEAVTRRALDRAAEEASEPADREHVTTWVKRRTDSFACVFPPAPPPLCRPDLRFTVDEPADLAYLRSLFARTREAEPSVGALIEAAGQRVEVS